MCNNSNTYENYECSSKNDNNDEEIISFAHLSFVSISETKMMKYK